MSCSSTSFHLCFEAPKRSNSIMKHTLRPSSNSSNKTGVSPAAKLTKITKLKQSPSPFDLMPPPGPTSPEDYAIIGDLLESVEQNPTSVEARKLLAQQYEQFGWTAAAADTAREILYLAPGDADAIAWLHAHTQASGTVAPSTIAWAPPLKTVTSPLMTVTQLEKGLAALMIDAGNLFQEMMVYQELCPELKFASQVADLKSISEGRTTSVVKVKPPPAARAVAEKIKNGTVAGTIAFADLEATARWVRNQANSQNSDQVRDAVCKRAEAIKAALPQPLRVIVTTAFMHVEHEILGKSYRNGDEQTMLGDPIAAVPRESFWVSEDGYAWDMAELAEALKANGGVMRNPLSKEMFSADDVRAIVRHKFGQPLAALQLKQQNLSKGVRKQTIDQLEQMATAMLDDESADAAASRGALDVFLGFLATLPEAEQAAFDELRVPAKDSHTNREFDVSLGDALADAKANRQCFHKTGDHLQQAARWLREQGRGAKVPGAWD